MLLIPEHSGDSACHRYFHTDKLNTACSSAEKYLNFCGVAVGHSCVTDGFTVSLRGGELFVRADGLFETIFLN